MMFDWGSFLNQIITSGVGACFTVLVGILVFVSGQFAVKLFVEPIQSQSKLLGEIANALTYYANEFGYASVSDAEVIKEISKIFREQASDLRSTAWTIKLYGLWQFMGIVPKKKNVLAASSELIGLSNMIFRDHSEDKDYYNRFDAKNKKINSYLNFE